MDRRKIINHLRDRRKHRVRTIVRGTSKRPRLSIFRSNRNILVQIIDDATGKTLVAASSGEIKGFKGTKTDFAKAVGKAIAEKAKKAKITEAVTDRGSYRYHGRVKALVEAAREGGLKI